MKSVVIGLSLSLASLLAYADGQQYQYEQDAVNRAALDPNEAYVNDDGALEDPNATMSPTARAYRNGYYNGKNAQREQNEQVVSVPPLPPESTQGNWAQRQARQAPRVPQSYGEQYGDVQYEAPRPVRPAPQVNVYVQPPVYAPRPEPVYTQPDPYYYAPPPGPPASTYVVVPGVPPALATGYWPRPYYARPQPALVVRGWVRWH